jgi:DNA-binding Lrp family transcriptional regulator
MSDNHHYVPLSQAAKELGISTEALRQRIHRNKMDGVGREGTMLKNLRQLRRAMYRRRDRSRRGSAHASSPKSTTRRVKNRLLGRLRGKAGGWGRLWR